MSAVIRTEDRDPDTRFLCLDALHGATSRLGIQQITGSS
jgi:hypothetical protein